MLPFAPGTSRVRGPVTTPSQDPSFARHVQASGPMIAVELRPPRADLGRDASMDAWMGLHSSVRRLLAVDTPLLLTDGAVGTAEEENLHHLVTNLDPEVPRALVCPFLTAKHTLEYCEWYAARALDACCDALTVLGGDKGVGHPRCVPHGYLLRQHLKKRFPELLLGAWANPHRDIAQQADFVAAAEYSAEFFLTQLVSHHNLDLVERFQSALATRSVSTPAVWGVFFYRSANPATLRRLSEFFPIPVEAVGADFRSGMSAIEVCAKTIRSLRSVGADKVYVSNLHPERAPTQLAAIKALL